MVNVFTRENIILNIVSIVIAALIVRLIYAWFDVVCVWAEQVYDEDYRDNYLKTTHAVAGAILITVICGFSAVLTYLIWLNHGAKR